MASTASFGTNSIPFRGSVLWNSTPDVIKSCNTQSLFSTKISNTGLVRAAIVKFVNSIIVNDFKLVGIY